MHPDIVAFSKRHGLNPDAVRELEALWGKRGPSASTTLFDGFASVDLRDAEERVDLPHSEADPAWVSNRYEDLGRIGEGGMGEVRRVRDLELNRVLAMKALHPPLLDRPGALARFLEEAQTTAQLQHPNIVPVHDMGQLPDGRVWFTMKEVRGRTLTGVIDELHAASGERWETAPSGWTFRQVVGAFHAVCSAVAYAHAHGVVHRDLKPDNVMVGAHGEVYVLDWGLAKVMGRPASPFDPGEDGVVQTRRSFSGEHHTRMGAIAGTPAYMAPEQARGEIDAIDARTDVYALGATLYEILSGRTPFQGPPMVVLAQLLAGPPASVRSLGKRPVSGRPRVRPPLPDELVEICERAMAPESADRFASASAMALELQSWLDGSRRREQALEVADRAAQGIAAAEASSARARTLQGEADALLASVPPWAPESEKLLGWERLASAERARREAQQHALAADQALQAALQIDPELPEAHAALAERHLEQHRLAERRRDATAQFEAETRLRAHANALPERHLVRRATAAYLAGDGALSLVTEPSAEVILFRYEPKNRRLVEVFDRHLGSTPLAAVPLPMGSYLAVLRHPSGAETRYPVEIARGAHWDGVAPGEAAPTPIPLTAESSEDALPVPAGWFRAAGDPELPASGEARRLWCDGFAMQRFPVTNAQYLAFLNQAVAAGNRDRALDWAPRDRPASANAQGALIYGFDGEQFSLTADADGDAWEPDWPVLAVDWHGARAYLAWLSECTGRPWRLPHELEWEKAARGVDGRFYPWGDHLDPSWCRMFASARGRAHSDFGPVAVDTHPVDISVYGLRGLGGNAQDWCANLVDGHMPTGDRLEARSYPSEGGMRGVRGGTWFGNANYARCCSRSRVMPGVRNQYLGFRGVYSL